VILAAVGIFYLYTDQEVCIDCFPPMIHGIIDVNNGTITVVSVEHGWFPNATWEDAEITSGSAILPSGEMKLGNVITNCSGVVTIEWKPCGWEIGTWDFT